MTKQTERDDIQQLDDGRWIVAFYSERKATWISRDGPVLGRSVKADTLPLLQAAGVPSYGTHREALEAAYGSHGDDRQVRAAIQAEKRPTLVI